MSASTDLPPHDARSNFLVYHLIPQIQGANRPGDLDGTVIK